MHLVHPFIGIIRIRLLPSQNLYPLNNFTKLQVHQMFCHGTRISPEALIAVTPCHVNIIRGQKRKPGKGDGAFNILRDQFFPEIFQPDIDHGQVQKTLTKGYGIFMGIAAIAVLFVREVFFISRKQIKYGSENIKVKIALGPEKRFVVPGFKTFDLYRVHTGFK